MSKELSVYQWRLSLQIEYYVSFDSEIIESNDSQATLNIQFKYLIIWTHLFQTVMTMTQNKIDNVHCNLMHTHPMKVL